MPQRPRTLLLPCLVEGLQEWLIRGSLLDCRAGAPLAQFDFADDKLIWTSSARGADARENSPKPTGVQATDKVHTRVCSCADMQQACLAFVPSFRPVILRWRKQFFCVRRPQAEGGGWNTGEMLRILADTAQGIVGYCRYMSARRQPTARRGRASRSARISIDDIRRVLRYRVVVPELRTFRLRWLFTTFPRGSWFASGTEGSRPVWTSQGTRDTRFG